VYDTHWEASTEIQSARRVAEGKGKEESTAFSTDKKIIPEKQVQDKFM